MSKKVKVLIVDDHPLMAEATAKTLQEIDFVQIVGIALNGESCLEMVEFSKPDIVFLDFNLPDQYGDEVAKRLKAVYPSMHLVIFTGIDFIHLYNHLIGLEVSAVISKESSGTIIKSLISLLLENYTMLPIPVFHRMQLLGRNMQAASLLEEDEIKIMSLIVQGSTNEHIAEVIQMSKRTIDNYIRKIYEKLGVKSRAQAVERFIQIKHIFDLNSKT
jgi:two-component system, NarL family, competent response regulator ComA